MIHNTLNISFQKDPLTLDPRESGDFFSSAVIFLLFKGLTRFEANQSVSCDLAESYHILNNHKTYVFQLGNHVWSDGSPITAHDFEYSWKQALSPDFPLRAINIFYYIKNAKKAKEGDLPLSEVGVYAQDDKTLVVELENPCPYFLELTSFCPMFPICAKAPKEKIFSVTSGAFSLYYWKPKKQLELIKNPAHRPFVHLGRISISIIPDEQEALSLFEKGDLDWIGDPVSPLPLSCVSELWQAKRIKPLAGMIGCWFNTLSPFIQSNPLRKALSHALSRQDLLQNLNLPNSLAARSFYPFDPLGMKQDTLIENCDLKAKKYWQIGLKELGLKKLRLSLTYENNEEFTKVSGFLKTMWESTFDNLSIELDPVPFKEFWQRLPKHQFEMALTSSISQYTDVIDFLERFEYGDNPRNFSGWEDSSYVELLKKYRKSTNSQQRSEIALKAEKVLLEEMPVAPLYYYHYLYLQKPYVKNLAVSPIGVMQFDRVILDGKPSFENLSQKDTISSSGAYLKNHFSWNS
ncbi:MAG: peptide ABC transporter substrate-binding protein [Rhabdochlamydiaceae bacterium]